MNHTELLIVRAFTAEGQGGNPAGLVLNADHLSAPEKQAIATAAGLSETAFVSASRVASLKLEFFTPRRQIAHCGHATIATFSYLSGTGRLADGKHSKETIDGLRDVRVAGGRAAMQQLSPCYADVDAAAVLDALKLAPEDVLEPFAPIRVDTGNGFILVGVRSPAVLAALVPDLPRIEALSETYDLVGFYVFSAAPGDGLDATARMFAPRFGIDEEAATGMAAGPLACLLHAHGGPSTFRIEQGRYMPQPSPSLLEAELRLTPGGIVTGLWVAGVARLEATRRIAWTVSPAAGSTPSPRSQPMKMLKIAAALLLPAMVVGRAWAEPSRDAADMSKVVRIPLLTEQLPETKTVGTVRGVRIDFQPGQRTGRHQHPIPTMGIVLSGAVAFQLEGKPRRVIRAGEAFFEPANATVLHFDNASDTEPASFVGFYLLGPGETEIIRPAP